MGAGSMIYHLEVISSTAHVSINDVLDKILAAATAHRATSDDIAEVVSAYVLHGWELQASIDWVSKMFDQGYQKETILWVLYPSD